LEGILHLEWWHSRDCARALVQDTPVIARSIEVLEAGVVPADSFDAEDKKAAWPSTEYWRPVHDLDEALAQGLLCHECLREPKFREDTAARTTEAIGPLLEAGWQLDVEDRSTWDQVFTVSKSLERDGTGVEVTCFEDNSWVTVYTYPSDYEGDPDNPMEPAFECGSLDELWSYFADQGWLD
jgi:hypothetical protein